MPFTHVNSMQYLWLAWLADVPLGLAVALYFTVTHTLIRYSLTVGLLYKYVTACNAMYLHCNIESEFSLGLGIYHVTTWNMLINVERLHYQKSSAF